jgi:hypothetical protein
MQLTLQHRGRELLHAIGLLLECIRLPTATTEERRGWRSDVSRSRKDLEGLYVAGLRRDFRDEAPGGKSVISFTVGPTAAVDPVD